MVVRIQLLQLQSNLFQQRTPIREIFELLESLPRDVKSRVARDDVPDKARPRLPIRKQARDISRIGRQNQIDREPALVDRKHAGVELIEKRRIRLVWSKVDPLPIARIPQNRSSKMSELVFDRFAEFSIQLLRRIERKTIVDIPNPQMRLLVIGRPMMDIRRLHISGRRRRDGVERAFFAIERCNLARDMKGPLPSLGW